MDERIYKLKRYFKSFKTLISVLINIYFIHMSIAEAARSADAVITSFEALFLTSGRHSKLYSTGLVSPSENLVASDF